MNSHPSSHYTLSEQEEKIQISIVGNIVTSVAMFANTEYSIQTKLHANIQAWMQYHNHIVYTDSQSIMGKASLLTFR